MAAVPGRALHYVFKIGDRAKNAFFFRSILGMQVSRNLLTVSWPTVKPAYIPGTTTCVCARVWVGVCVRNYHWE